VLSFFNVPLYLFICVVSCWAKFRTKYWNLFCLLIWLWSPEDRHNMKRINFTSKSKTYILSKRTVGNTFPDNCIRSIPSFQEIILLSSLWRLIYRPLNSNVSLFNLLSLGRTRCNVYYIVHGNLLRPVISIASLDTSRYTLSFLTM